MRLLSILYLVTSLLLSLSLNVSAAPTFSIIAHRGASGYLPEHTLAAVALAHAQQADYIEQDVVLSKDNVPMILHDIHLDTVTNVETVFPNRKRQDGRYYAIDFTLEELRQLRVHERQNLTKQAVFPNRYSGSSHFTIPTLADEIELIANLNRLTHQNTGMYIEIKSPAWHQAQGKDISKHVLAMLDHYNMNNSQANIIIQCFNFAEIKRLKTQLATPLKLVQLIGEDAWQEGPTSYKSMKTIAGIKDVAKYADGIGPWLGHISQASSGHPELLAEWVAYGKSQGLLIHPYTFRKDALPANTNANELLHLLLNVWQVDGIFTDQVPTVSAYLNRVGNR